MNTPNPIHASAVDPSMKGEPAAFDALVFLLGRVEDFMAAPEGQDHHQLFNLAMAAKMARRAVPHA